EADPIYGWTRVPVGERSVAVVTIRRLAGSLEEEALLDEIGSDLARYADVDAVLFDLRGNRGGNDEHVVNWLREATEGRFYFGVDLEVLGAAGACLDWNWRVAAFLSHGEIDSDAARAELQERKKAVVAAR